MNRKEVLRHQLGERGKVTKQGLRDFILGFQDGAVNTLGLVSAFAESLSMAAVAYTSTKAAQEFYESKKEQELNEIKNIPGMEKEEIRQIYYKKGFHGKELEKIVKKITSNRKLWVDTMMKEELNLIPDDYNEGKSALIVGFAAIIGCLIPIVPFFLFNVKTGMIVSLLFTIIMLFIVGV